MKKDGAMTLHNYLNYELLTLKGNRQSFGKIKF